MRRFFPGISLLLFVLAALPVQAQKTGIGKYAGEFMSSGVGGRALAMGGAYVAVANDVTAAYWNPAGLTQIQYPEIGLMYEQRFGGLLNYNYGGVAWPFGPKYTLALTVTRMGIDDIPDTRNAYVDANNNGQIDPGEVDYNKITLFNVSDWAAYMTYAYRQNDNMSYGVNLKLIRRSLAEASAFGIGFDAGMLMKIDENLTFGAAVQDVTTTLIAWSTGTKDLVSPTAKVGAAYSINALGGRITPALDLDLMGENRRTASAMHVGPVSISPRAGVEYQFRNLFALRAGYNDAQFFSFGAGVHFPKLHLDYAFGQNPMNDGFGNRMKDPTHRISLRLTLEEKQYFRGN